MKLSVTVAALSPSPFEQYQKFQIMPRGLALGREKVWLQH